LNIRKLAARKVDIII